MIPGSNHLRDRRADGRSRGSMAQSVREVLALDAKGRTRRELRDTIRAQPRFWNQFERNPKAYDNMIRRLILRGDIEERDDMLHASEQARLEVLVHRELFELNRDGLKQGGRECISS